MDKAEVLNKMKTARSELDEMVSAFDAQQMLAPALPGGWSVKDSLAHIEFWERRVIEVFSALSAGRQPEPMFGGVDTDAVNQRVLELNRTRQLDEVRQSEQAAYQTFLSLVEQASPEDLFDGSRFAWTQGQPFVDWIDGNTYGHYPEHIEAMRACLGI